MEALKKQGRQMRSFLAILKLGSQKQGLGKRASRAGYDLPQARDAVALPLQIKLGEKLSRAKQLS